MYRKILVTGGAGFIGSNFLRFLLRERPQVEVLNLDLLTYAGNLENLADIEADPRYSFVQGDVCDAELIEKLMVDCDAVVHMAAESHVDRSINDAAPFVRTNILGTQVMLDAARRAGGRRFLQVGTDEVYGSLVLEDSESRFSESSPLNPSSPYAASKAAGDLLALSYMKSCGLQAMVTRCSNNFGPYQFPEKVIPLFVTNLIEKKKIPLYGDGLNVRDWLQVEDHCRALLAVLEGGRAGEIYNIGGGNPRSNLELAGQILDIMGLDDQFIEYVPDRAGHDRRYAVDYSKITEELDWRPAFADWSDALRETVTWYLANRGWWQGVKARECRG
jgi:dTDP-glucose 4,6-dehydratase